MKNLFLSTFAFVTIALSACNSGGKSSEEESMSKMENDTIQKTTEQSESDISVLTPTFSGLDQNIAAYIKTITQHYLHVKNALANDNSSEAASAGKAIVEAMNKLDKSLFTTDQKKVYDENEGDLKEHAEDISKKSGNIEDQRKHFSMMSEDIYSLVKAFGGGQTLYHDHCPMYNDNRGALWLSETKEIKNPYMGSKMPTCGKVQEKIQM